MSQSRILIVHPDPSTLTLLSSMLRSLGQEIDEAANDRVAVRLIERGGVDLVLAGVDPMDVDAMELLSYMRRKHRQVPVILLFTSPMPERAKEALRLGALNVLKYPVPATELRAAVTQALAPRGMNGCSSSSNSNSPHSSSSHPQPFTPSGYSQAQSVVSGGDYPGSSMTSRVSAPARAEQVARELGIVGSDPSLRQAIELAGTIAATRTPVLIVGEPGTGKTLLARMIHILGPRRDQPFVIHESAAARGERDDDTSGATADPETEWSSKLHEARGGTLFLDEVTRLPASLQEQLLQALQEHEYEGSHCQHATPVDARFLMSTSGNLPALVEQGTFRQDLSYRISVICLKLPPLRHRSGDIEALAEYFRTRSAHEFGKKVVGFTHDALDALLKHDWPGNVRELEGVIRRGVILCQGTRITSGHLSSSLSPPRSSRNGSTPRPSTPMSIRPLKEALEEPEKRIIIEALQALNWNRQETARVLDINRTTLYKKMKKYGLLVDGPIWVN
jgi:two-component system, NtrC family, response regulator HydG